MKLTTTLATLLLPLAITAWEFNYKGQGFNGDEHTTQCQVLHRDRQISDLSNPAARRFLWRSRVELRSDRTEKLENRWDCALKLYQTRDCIRGSPDSRQDIEETIRGGFEVVHEEVTEDFRSFRVECQRAQTGVPANDFGVPGGFGAPAGGR